MLPLTKEELKSHQDTEVCYICGETILKKLSKSINYRKVRDHCYYTREYRIAAHSICNLKFMYSIKVVIHNGLNYDYNFIMKELGSEF